jgi:hypothetical protein
MVLNSKVSKKTLYTFFAICSIILLRSWLIELYNISIVSPLLTKIASNIYNDVTLIILSIVLLGIGIKRFQSKYIPNYNILLLTCAICIIYCLFRIRETVWTFQFFHLYKGIKYADIILLYATIELILFARQKLSKRNPPSADIRYSFELDEPATNDELNRLDYAKAIAKRIQGSKSLKALAIGVTGEWGSGKTSFLNLIENQLSKDDSLIIMKFNPWDSNNSRSIINNFFQQLSNQLSYYNANISSDMLSYASKLNEAYSNNYTQGIYKSLKIITGNDSLNDLYTKIDDSIKSINKHLIVFIDDIDRLDKEEVIEVIRLIRNTANFNNTCFIAAYDKSYVLNAIELINPYNVEYFLEKIFQVEIPLPKYDESILRDKLYSSLEKHINEADKEEFDEISLRDGLFVGRNSFSYKILTTPRDVSRFSNSFLLSYDMLMGEVLLEDLFKIELIKLKFPLVYDLIYEKCAKFFESTNEQIDESRRIYQLKTESGHSSNRDSTLLIKYIRENHKVLNIDFSKIDIVEEAILNTFKENRHFLKSTEHLSINNPPHFYKYFHLGLRSSSLSEKEFTQYRKMPLREFLSQIDIWESKKKHIDLIIRFMQIHKFDNKADFEQIVQGIFHSIRITTEMYRYSDRSLAGILYDGQRDGVSKLYYSGNKEEGKKFIISVLKAAPAPYYSDSGIIRYLIKYQNDCILSDEELLQINIDYLRQYLETKTVLDRNAFALLHTCIYIERIPNGNNSTTLREHISDDARKLFKDFILNKDSDGFVESIIEHFRHDAGFFSVSADFITKKLFDSFGDFELFMDNLPKTSKVEEFKSFYEKTKANSYGAVEFQFSNIDLNISA